MRLGILDVGSNTVHFVVVNAIPGGAPTPMSNWKTTMRLVEYLDDQGAITDEGVDILINNVAYAHEVGKQFKVDEMLPFATSAVRSATNAEDVLKRVEEATGVRLTILSGQEEAELTFLAVRRWYGWSAGRIVDLDIGGGSLELSSGVEELPDAAVSVELGAARLTYNWFDTDPPEQKKISALRDFIDAELQEPAKKIKAAGDIDLPVATSKTFKMLARLTGAAPSSAGVRVPRQLTRSGLRQIIAFISRMTAADRADLEGISADRSYQIVAGALVAERAMKALGIEAVQICPWALREGVIFQYIDSHTDALDAQQD